MVDELEQKPTFQSSDEPQSSKRDISRRTVVVGLVALAAEEAVAGGVTWQTFSQLLHKIILAFAPLTPTPISQHPGATLLIYRGHSSGVNAVSWSPNSKRIASGSDDQTVQVWDATTGGHDLIYRGHSGVVHAVAWSIDGTLIASGGRNSPSSQPGVLTVSPTSLDAGTNCVKNSDGSCTYLVTLSETSDSQSNLNWTASSDVGATFNPPGGTLTPGGHQQVSISGMACQNGSFAFTGPANTAILKWTCESPTPVPPTPTATPTSVPPPLTDTTLQVRDILNGHKALTYRGQKGGVTAMTPNPTPANTPTPVPPNPTPTDTPTPVPPTPTATPPLTDTTVQIWEAATGRKIRTYQGHKDGVTAVAWSPDGKRIASASDDKTVRVWDATTGSTLLIYRKHATAVLDVAWSPDSKSIASASGDQTVQVWDASSGKTLFTHNGHAGSVDSVAWSPDGTRLASGSYDTTVQVWNATNGGSASTYRGHTSAVTAVAWSPDSKSIASASSDQTVQVWNATTGIRILTYAHHLVSVTTVAWSPDGTRIASGSRDTTVQVWRAV